MIDTLLLLLNTAFIILLYFLFFTYRDIMTYLYIIVSHYLD